MKYVDVDLPTTLQGMHCYCLNITDGNIEAEKMWLA